MITYQEIDNLFKKDETNVDLSWKSLKDEHFKYVLGKETKKL